MKMTTFLMLLMCWGNGYSQQSYIYDSHGNLIGGSHLRTLPGKPVTLIDDMTSTKFILDSAHINVYAINVKGDTLWKTDPWKDNHVMEYRVKRPVIVQFQFKIFKVRNSKGIHIVYNNTQFGIIDTKTGSFMWEGQD